MILLKKLLLSFHAIFPKTENEEIHLRNLKTRQAKKLFRKEMIKKIILTPDIPINFEFLQNCIGAY